MRNVGKSSVLCLMVYTTTRVKVHRLTLTGNRCIRWQPSKYRLIVRD